ncbi:MAG: right-handed parallel beta-helix repeat-containing protein [Candidatus Eisenbacteria sp.]|nr:right-handed parallel beta-helix repeat-containing protein [Candidatus Eisenbacteria bacterium]
MKAGRACVMLVSLLLVIATSSPALAQLTGIKYIGGQSPDYSTVEEAIDDLNAQGVGEGGVTFLIRDGVYEENENLMISGVSATAENPVIFRPDVDATAEIRFTLTGAQHFGIRLHDSDHVCFNGAPYQGRAESRNLTINAWRINDEDIFTIWISNGSDHCSLENLIVFNEDTSDRTGWSMPVYLSTYGVTSPEVGMDAIGVSNCELVGGSTYGLFMDGDPGIQLTNFQIVGNDIHDFARYGIHVLTDVIDCNIEGNEVYQTFEGRSSVYGIRAGSSSCSGLRIHHNYIHDLMHEPPAKPYGIFMTSNCHDNLVYNNIIHLLPAPTANKAYGIYCSSGDYANNRFYYNTIYLGGTSTIDRDSYCLYVYKDASDDVLKNNILINDRTGGNGKHYAIRMKAITFAESDYNFLTVTSDDPLDNCFVARIGSVDYNTLADLQGAPGYTPRDRNSLSGDPDLIYPDLHLNEASGCIGKATPIALISTDFDYEERDAVTPDMGADEFHELSDVSDVDAARAQLPRLLWNSPNPFGARVTISYEMPEEARIELAVYDVHGRLVRNLETGSRLPGRHLIQWDGRGEDGRALPSGVYFCRLEIEGRLVETRKLALLR